MDGGGCSRTTETIPNFHGRWRPSMDGGGYSRTTETIPRTVETIHGWRRSPEIEETDLQMNKIEKRCNKSLELIAHSELHDFATNKSSRFFQILGINQNFMDSDPSTWDNNNPSFQMARAHLKTLQVVNDHAERGVALIKQFNKTLTQDEEQFQYRLQIVSHHRSAVPDAKKSLLM